MIEDTLFTLRAEKSPPLRFRFESHIVLLLPIKVNAKVKF